MINIEKRLKRSEILEKSWQVFNSIECENQSILDSQITTFLSRFYNSNTNKINFRPSNASGHITLNTPVLVRSPKLSNVESSQYLDGWPPGNTGCCWSKPNFFARVSRVLRDPRQVPNFSFPFSSTLRDWKRLDLALSDANGHITLNTPVLVRSPKLSNVEPG